MDVASLYASKLTTPETAVADIPSGSKLSIAMAMFRAARAARRAGGPGGVRVNRRSQNLLF